MLPSKRTGVQPFLIQIYIINEKSCFDESNGVFAIVCESRKIAKLAASLTDQTSAKKYEIARVDCQLVSSTVYFKVLLDA